MSKLLLCLILLIALGIGQQGGGGSSGGSSSGTTYYSSPSYYGGYGYGYGYPYGSSYYYSRRPTCEEGCYGNSICIQNCQSQSKTAGIIVGSVFGGICLCCLSFLLCRHFKCCRGKSYSNLQSHYVNVDKNSMSAQEFKMKRDRILSLINSSDMGNNFALQQTGDRAYIRAHADIVKEDDLNTQLRLVGSDKFGSWTGKGNIYAKHGGIFFWMSKEYDNREASGQTDAWHDLIYESSHYDDRTGLLQGRWFYHGVENNPKYSGQWKLWPPTIGGGQIINYGNQYGNQYGNNYSPPAPTPYFNNYQ